MKRVQLTCGDKYFSLLSAWNFMSMDFATRREIMRHFTFRPRVTNAKELHAVFNRDACRRTTRINRWTNTRRYVPSNVKGQVRLFEKRKNRYARYLCNFPSENMTGAITHVPWFNICKGGSLCRRYAYLVPSGFMFIRSHKWHSRISHGHCHLIERRIADGISNLCCWLVVVEIRSSILYFYRKLVGTFWRYIRVGFWS